MLLTRYSEKTPSQGTFSIKNATWCDLGLNLGICHGRPVTNHTSHGLLKTCTINQTTILQLTIQPSTHYTMISWLPLLKHSIIKPHTYFSVG
jgi:hypothetical protein